MYFFLMIPRQGILSILIYAFVRRIENPVSIDNYMLYWTSLWIGIAAGIFSSIYGIGCAKRKIDQFARGYACSLQEKREDLKFNYSDKDMDI